MQLQSAGAALAVMAFCIQDRGKKPRQVRPSPDGGGGGLVTEHVDAHIVVEAQQRQVPGGRRRFGQRGVDVGDVRLVVRVVVQLHRRCVYVLRSSAWALGASKCEQSHRQLPLIGDLVRIITGALAV